MTPYGKVAQTAVSAVSLLAEFYSADSAKRLELKVGKSVHPVIKASNVMIMVD